MPAEVEELFVHKTALIAKMRGLEQDMKSYLRSKVLNLKEDVLAGNASVKRIVKVLVEVGPGASVDSWTIRIQGKVEGSDIAFLSLFEKIKVKFSQADQPAPYVPVQWTKAKSAVGSSLDGITIERNFPPASDSVQASLSFFIENTPKKFRLSEPLQHVLGLTEDTRAKVVAALWQYIKSNRL